MGVHNPPAIILMSMSLDIMRTPTLDTKTQILRKEWRFRETIRVSNGSSNMEAKVPFNDFMSSGLWLWVLDSTCSVTSRPPRGHLTTMSLDSTSFPSPAWLPICSEELSTYGSCLLGHSCCTLA